MKFKSIQPSIWLSSAITTAVCFAIFHLYTASTFDELEEERYRNYVEENNKVFAIPVPAAMDFAGETVPLHLSDAHEKLDRELLVNTYWQSQTMLFIKRAHRWFPVIEPILAKHGVPDDFKYLPVIESGLLHVVSPAGAAGYWQLMKDAATEYGLVVNEQVDERYHVEKSTEAACAYLKEAYEKFGSWTLAAASYNMGMAGISKQLTRQKTGNYYDLVLNDETSRYVFRLLAIKHLLSNPKAAGFVFRDADLYGPLSYDVMTVSSSVADLAEFAHQQKLNYKALKYLNPWLRDTKLDVKEGVSYELKIPDEKQRQRLIYQLEPVATFTAPNEQDGGSGESQPTE